MFKAIAFTMEEALALIYGIKLLDQQKGIIKSPGQVKEKLLGLLPKTFSNEIERIGQRVEIEVAGGRVLLLEKKTMAAGLERYIETKKRTDEIRKGESQQTVVP